MCFYNYLAWNVAHSVWLPDCVFIPLIATDSAWHKWFSLWMHWTALQPIFKAGFGVCVLFFKRIGSFLVKACTACAAAWAVILWVCINKNFWFAAAVIVVMLTFCNGTGTICHNRNLLIICVRLSSGYWLAKKWHFNSFQIKAYGQYLQKKKKHAKKRKNSLLFCEQYDKESLLWL